MKRLLSLLLCLSLALPTVVPLRAEALKAETQSKLAEANDELREVLGTSGDYYTPTNSAGKPLNEALLNAQEYALFAYGTPEEASKAAGSPHYSKGEYRCYGYAKYGDLFTNPDFPADYTMTKYADTKNFVEQPWNKTGDYPLIGRLLGQTPAVFDMDEVYKAGQPEDFYRRSIAMGIGLQYGIYWEKSMKGEAADTLRSACAQLARGYSGNMVSGAYLTLPWERYCHIIQPPTKKSWGTGVLFHSQGTRYFSVSLPPLELIDISDDLSVAPHSIPNDIWMRQSTEITLALDSTYPTPQETVYKWEIINAATGQPVEGVVYSGLGEAAEGRLTIVPNRALTHEELDGNPEVQDPQLVRAQFVMPESNVIVRFRLNNLVPDDPREKNITNNLYTGTIRYKAPLTSRSTTDLDYNVLTKELAYPLGLGAGHSASVSLPRGFWTGNLRGSLNIDRVDVQDHLKNYTVLENPPVNEDSSSVTRNPIISATLTRPTFGDDPAGGHFLNLGAPWTPLQGVVDFWSGGSVSRPWRDEWTDYCSNDTCGGHRRSVSGTARGDFDTRLDILGLTCHVYNGMATLPAIPSRNFRKAVDQNSAAHSQRLLYWISDPYRLDVLRWMVHQKLDPALDEYQQVYCQYPRTFTQQNTGSLTYQVEEAMKDIYRSERSAARRGDTAKGSYPNIVFPTDRDLQGFDYPIKSGYYLTPRGQYTVTVKTSQYKDTPANTAEHADLVQRVIDAFHYQSDLYFTLDGKDIYGLDLTADNNRIQGTAMLRIDKDYQKDYEELVHTEDSVYAENDSYNDRRIREILEGYADSATLTSRTSYKYREYMQNQDRLYKVDEETLITITVNPSRKKLYTYVNMPDSDRTGSPYAMRAWFENISLNSYRYSGLTLTGRPYTDSGALDTISFTVKGSMYDDVNN